ncbi:MAG: substrate-binding domain-containing protein [Acidobacteria bacterium]|nr:substrate-binding domain-containing protein [Acidobacteriota bacterium]
MKRILRRSWIVRAAIAAVAVAWVFMPVVAPAQSGGGPAAPVTLNARLTAESVPFVLANLQQLDAAERKSTVEYIVAGSADARAAFVSGEVDLIVSGIDLSDAERKALQASGRGAISAPVQATAMEVFGFVPQLGLFPSRCQADPETGEEPEDCSASDRIPYNGPIRFGPESLINIFLTGIVPNVWVQPPFSQGVSSELPAGYDLIPPVRGARPLVRSDGDAFNFYLDAYFAAIAPQLRREALGSGTTTPPVSETWPGFLTPSRQGMDNVVSTIASGLDPGSSELPLGGVAGVAFPGAVSEAFAVNAGRPPSERVPVFRAQVKNAAGEWLLPTPDSITAAVALDGGKPLAAATNPVAGAYPIAWVNRAYVPASGLTADEANAAASFIRLQVTAGQGRAAAQGDGRLPAALVSEALAAADRVVESNCASAKGTVTTSSDGAPWLPAGTLSVGPVKLCRGAASPEPTPPTEGSTGEFDAGFSDAGFSDLGVDTGSTDVPAGFDELAAEVAGEQLDAGAAATGGAVDASASSGAAGSSSGATATAVSRRMPLPIPGQTLPPLDRAVTLGLGALFAMVVWKLYERRTGFG